MSMIAEAAADRPLTQTMRALSDGLASIADLFGPKSEVAYLDLPYHPNTGDRLIEAGTEAFFRRHNVRVVYRCTVDDYREDRLRRVLAPGTVIALHGGGNFGTIWPHHHDFRERIVSTFTDRRIVVLPQSIHFEDDAARAASAARFRAHPDLAICVRDRESAEVASTFSREVHLMPDMAHALWGEIGPTGPPSRDRPLYLMRTDKESRHTRVPPEATVTDWLTWLGPGDRRIRGAIARFYRIADRAHGMPFVPDASWFVRLDGSYLIRKAVRLFSPYPLVITDRLHAMILACLLQRPVHFHDNSYGKLTRYAGCWLDGVEGVKRIAV